MSLLDMFNMVVGQPPAGYEIMGYIMAALIGYHIFDVLLDMFRFAYDLVSNK